MASRLLLHIGTEKTGTTAWQSWLASQRVSLDQLGFAVPQTLGPTNHRKLPTSCFNLDRVDDFVIRSGLGQITPLQRHAAYLSWQQEFTAEIQKRPHHTWIVSSEHLSSRLTCASELDRLYSFLKPLFSEIVVHLVIRDPLQTAISAWSTLVRCGGYTLEELPLPDHPLLVNRCHHRIIVERWMRVFSQFRVHTYEPEVVCLLRRGLGLPDGLNSGVKNPVKNPSLSHRAIVEIARVNRQLPVYRGTTLNPEREQRIASIVEAYADAPGFQPSSEQQERFSSYFADSVAWIQREFFPERLKLFN